MTHLSHNDLILLSNTAISAAIEAGQIIATHSKTGVSIQKKTGGENLASQVVTEVDLLCQEAILKTLLPTCTLFDLAVLTEESDDDKQRLEKDFFWSIDPLDGTLPFIESTPGYAVSIALVSNSGIPLIGVIYDPVRQTLYQAIKGSGAFRNKQPWLLKPSFLPPSSVPEKQLLTIVSDRSFVQQNNYTQIMQKLKSIAAQSGFAEIKTIQHGGAAMNACWVLEHSPGCYFKFPKPQDGGGSLWDYAATTCLFKEMGAIVSDIYGQPLELNRSDSTFMNHQGVLYATDEKIAASIRNIFNSL
ncbi:MAG: inositol monophosphatase [Gammaproteobacteria bacterium]|nr:inositol monophosphatase [Gammaproteobacteria bacterium]